MNRTSIAAGLLALATGVAAAAPAAAQCPPDPSIPEIQGAGHVSPCLGVDVTTSGVVTAVAFNGFYLQDPEGDGDDATADGIFIFTSGAPSVAVGNVVEVSGPVSEFIPGGAASGNLSTTQLATPDVSIAGSAPLPDPVVIGLGGRVPPNQAVISDDELPVNLQNSDEAAANPFDPDEDGIDFYESLESMLVVIEEPVAVSATRTFSSVSSELFVVTNDGAAVFPPEALTPRGALLLQPDPDHRGDQNPERVQVQFDGTLFPADVPAIAVGDLLGNITGVVGYSFGNFEVNATQPFEIIPGLLEEESTELEGGRRRLTVASYNVLNLSPLPEDDAQRAELASQIVGALGSPDIIALQEVQDDSGEADDGTVTADMTLQALVDAVVTAGGPRYRFFDVPPADGASGGVPGGNIRNAFLYNPARVERVDFVSLTPDVLAAAGVGNPDAFLGTRDPLVGTFLFNRRTVTIINNHLTSRTGSTPVFGAIQPFVQAGEDEREAQVQALNDYVDFLLEEDRHARIIVAGDLNTFQFTNDLVTILPGEKPVLFNLVDLLESDRKRRFRDDEVYTFNFEGNSQVLDHMLVTKNLLHRARFDIVHVNVDFPDGEGLVAASDHEPIIGRFRLLGPVAGADDDLELASF
jgi:predicted extracellular nuclease